MADSSKSTNGLTIEVEQKDLIAQNRIWIAALKKEKQCRISWEKNWQPLFESLNASQTATRDADITTNSLQVNFKRESEKYGSRLETKNGSTIRDFEFQIHSNHRKRRILLP